MFIATKLRLLIFFSWENFTSLIDLRFFFSEVRIVWNTIWYYYLLILTHSHLHPQSMNYWETVPLSTTSPSERKLSHSLYRNILVDFRVAVHVCASEPGSVGGWVLLVESQASFPWFIHCFSLPATSLGNSSFTHAHMYL